MIAPLTPDTGHDAASAGLTAQLYRIRRNDTIVKEYADVAQLVEQLIRNQQVIGSSPIVGSI